jgi:hypothetical protein
MNKVNLLVKPGLHGCKNGKTTINADHDAGNKFPRCLCPHRHLKHGDIIRNVVL